MSRARRVLAGLAGLLAIGSAAALGWTRRAERTGRVEGAAARNAGCEGCHEEIAEEWRASRHREAYTNAAFQASLGREHPEAQPFCRGCHAPLADPGAPAPAGLAAIGVGCVTCHERGGVIVTGERNGERGGDGDRNRNRNRDGAPHPVVREAGFATEGCARCHEFAFPNGAERMQRTMEEHRAGGGGSCAGCHMPRSGEHGSHRFRGGHDEALVRSALRVTAARPLPSGVRITLAPEGVSHAVPTGDLFRRLAVTVEGVGEDGAAVGTVRRYLARHFSRVQEGGTVEVGDDRPHASARIVEIVVGEVAARLRLRWRVEYERVASHAGEDEARGVVEGRVMVAEGLLP